MHFDEAVEKVNSTAVIRDWFTLLLEVELRQSDVAPEQLNAIKSWLGEEDNHSLLAIRTSDVEGNISAYLVDNESTNDEGRVVVYRLLLQGVEVDVELDVDNLSTRRCTESRWHSLDGTTGGGGGGCLFALVSRILHADNRVVVAVL